MRPLYRLPALLALLLLLSQPALAQEWAWAQRAGGNLYGWGSGIAVDAAGNAYVTGYFYGTADFGPLTLTSAGERDVFVAKYAPDGDVLWATSGGGTNLEIGRGVAVDAAGNAYVTGFFEGTADFGPFALTSAGGPDVFVAKYAADGTVLWAQRAGGIGSDYGNGIAVDAAGNAYVTGHFQGAADFGPFILTSAGVGNVFVARLAPGPTAAEPLPDAALPLSASPNPATGAATIRFALTRPSPVRLAVHDLLGREVAVLAEGAVAAGEHAVAFDASGLPAGVYLLRLTTEEGAATRRLTVTR